MKFISQISTLNIAIAFSVIAHGALLAVQFTAPETFRFKPADPGLEVILVNAKHDKKPVKAQALAQANLDGGGNAEEGRAKSPLPDMRKSEDGDSIKAAKRKVAELEELQRQILSQNVKKTSFSTAPVVETDKLRERPPAPDGMDQTESARAIARMEAEISKRLDDYNKRPKKTHISPSTREVGYAMYFDSVRQKIEKYGTLNFPQKDGKKMYGELIVSISIDQDGQLYAPDGDGGLTIDKSSRNPALDAAAARIVRRSAPFPALPKNMRSQDKNDVWIMTTSFKFTRDDSLEAVMSESRN